MWCWRRLLRVPWTERRSNQSILKEISPGICLEEMMLKLKLQYFGHLMRRVDSFWKRLWCWEGLGAGGEGENRGWDGWMASPTRWTWVWVNSRSLWWTGRPGVLRFMESQSRTRLSDWTELNKLMWGFPCGLPVRNPPAKQEAGSPSMCWEDPWRRKWPSTSRILAWQFPWTEEAGGLQSMGSRKSRAWLSDWTTTNKQTKTLITD